MQKPRILWSSMLLTAVIMAALWIGARTGLTALIGSGAVADIAAILSASIAGSIFYMRTTPYGSWEPIAKLTDAARAMRDGDLSVRAPEVPDGPLSKLSHALNEAAEAVSTRLETRQKELELVSGILDGMVEGVIVFDKEGSIVLANLSARRLAVSTEDIIGRSAIEALRNAQLADAVERALTRGESVEREIDTGGVLGRRLLVRTSEHHGKGGGGGVVAVLRDVTNLRRLETIRTEFVANVSHELRTPVTAITTAAETLLGGALDDPSDAAEFVGMIERNARRLRRLVDDILDLSKIESKAYTLAPAVQDLHPIFVAAEKLVEDAAGRRRMRVKVETEGPIEAWIDRHAFEQVLGNLVENAVKYAGEGATITVGARVENGRVVVLVRDTGAGIAPQHLERLFERFYRVDTGRSREMGGTGLGLAIVKHLVEAMEGEITVASTLGRGTTFTILLHPEEPPKSAHTSTPPPSSAAETQG